MEKRCPGCMKQKQDSPVCEHCGFDETAGNASHQLPMGTVLKEQYLIGKVLGQGGFGITYLGWDQYLDLPVAIKEYYPSGLVMRDCTVTTEVIGCGGDTAARFASNKERFLREAKMLARFSQVPQIVQIRNFFLANNTAYIVMEYVEGITLKQYVKDQGGRISPEKALRILGPVIEALEKVHNAGLVHRDISPDNIMMLPGGGAKLLDFGAGRDVGSAMVGKNLTSSTEAILKPGYAPIEQYQKRGNLGPWTDVYAMCGTIYYCLTGEVPPDAPERMLEYEEELFGEITGLTASQRKALEHGIALRTEQRTGSMEQLRQELLQQDAPEPEPEPEPELPPEPKPERTKTPEPKPEPEKKAEPRTRTHSQRKTGTEKKLPTDAPTINVSRKEEAKDMAEKTEAKAPVRREKKKKKKFPVALVILVLAAVVCAGIFWPAPEGSDIAIPTLVDRKVTGSCGTDATWTLHTGSGELVISGSGSTMAYASAETANTPWQSYNDQIKTVTLTDSVSSIGAYSFAGLKNLKTVTIGPKVRVIGRGAFQGSAVKTVNFETEEDGSTALMTIAMDAFRESALEQIILPDSVETIAGGVFAGCDELVMAQLGRNTIPSFAGWDVGVFRDVSEDFVLHCGKNSPASEYAALYDLAVSYTDSNAWAATGQCGENLYYSADYEAGYLKITGTGDMWDFIEKDGKDSWNTKGTPPWIKYADKIRVLTIGDGVTSVGEFAFQQFTNLKYVNWGNTLNTISSQAFLNSGLQKIVFPENITEIERYAFTWNQSLESVILPDGLKTLRMHSFNRCYSLREFFIGGKTQIEYGTYTPFNQNYEDERNLPPHLTIFSLRDSPAQNFASRFGFKFSVGAMGMTVEDGGKIGDDAYWFTNGDTLVLYGNGATWKYNLTKEDVESWAKWEYNAGRAYLSRPKFWEKRGELRHIIILPGLDELGNGLFNGLNLVETIDCGTVKRWYADIGFNTALESIVFPETLQTLGGYTFVSTNLKEVTFLGNTRIEDMAFSNSFSLRHMYFYGNAQFRGELTSFEGAAADVFKGNLVFHGPKYTYAEQYAQKHGLQYEYME